MSPDDLLRQAKITACDYFVAAETFIADGEIYEQSFDNIMRLAELMARDFEFMMTYQAKQGRIDE